MKKIFCFFITIIAIFSFVGVVQAVEDVTTEKVDKLEYSLFHLDTCPHCHDEIEFLEKKVLPKYGAYLDFNMYEVTEPENQDLFRQYQYFHKVQSGGVPLAIIGDEVVYGYGTDKTTGAQIMDSIERQLADRGIIEKTNNTNSTGTIEQVCEDGESCVTVPVLGRVDAKTISLPVLTVVLGFLDGFNPCAMWVLLFLISLLLGMKDRKRMWLLGSIFIVASGVVYFIFMAAWLQFILFIGMVTIVRLLIGIVAAGVGGFQLRDWWKNRKSDGVVCKVSGKEGTKKTFEKIKDIVYKKSLWWSIMGIILLGFSVNLVELACSAGFPAIFTQVLAINEIPQWQRYLYMFGYIILYMIDDIIVFAIAMFTLKSKTIGGRYAKYANLIGGALIFILGLLLIFKPEWLMFG